MIHKISKLINEVKHTYQNYYKDIMNKSLITYQFIPYKTKNLLMFACKNRFQWKYFTLKFIPLLSTKIWCKYSSFYYIIFMNPNTGIKTKSLWEIEKNEERRSCTHHCKCTEIFMRSIKIFVVFAIRKY